MPHPDGMAKYDQMLDELAEEYPFAAEEAEALKETLEAGSEGEEMPFEDDEELELEEGDELEMEDDEEGMEFPYDEDDEEEL